MFERIKCILVKEFLQVLRDPRMRTIIFVVPLVQVFIFGYAANTDIKNIPTAVYDLDNTKESRDLIREFTYSKYFIMKYFISTDAEQKALIDKGHVNTIIRINRGFARNVQGNKTAKVQFIVDGTDSNTADIVLGYAGQIVARYSNKVLKSRTAIFAEGLTPYARVDTRDRSWFNVNLISRNYYIPGVIALVITVMTLILTAMAIVREKEIGTMEQLMVSPILPVELMIGKMLPFGIIALIDVAMVTALGVFWFHIPIRGSILLLLFATTIYLMTCLGCGLLISTIAETQQEAVMSVFLFYFPVSLLSGFMFPIMNMPQIIQYITYLNPMRYYIVILRGIFLKGVGINILWPQILILMIMGAGILAVSSLKFQKRL